MQRLPYSFFTATLWRLPRNWLANCWFTMAGCFVFLKRKPTAGYRTPPATPIKAGQNALRYYMMMQVPSMSTFVMESTG